MRLIHLQLKNHKMVELKYCKNNKQLAVYRWSF